LSATAPVPDQLSDGKVAAADFATRDLVLTATLTVRVSDVSTAVTKAEGLAVSAKGYVASETVAIDPAHRADDNANMTLRVPESAYPTAITALGKLGVLTSKQQSVEDVTDQLIDVRSRLSSAKAGISRLRTLLARTTSLGQIINLESELTKRESDLESLEHRVAALSRPVALATINVNLTKSVKAAAGHHRHRSGFIGGVLRGWHALTATVTAVLSALGSMLPFVLVAAAIAAAAVLGRRRLVAARAAGVPATRGDAVDG
jgi:hypothetical protein